MRGSALSFLMLLASCGANEPPVLSLLDLAPCPGWTGALPATERQFARAAAAEQAGRLCANSKLAAATSAIGDEQ